MLPKIQRYMANSIEKPIFRWAGGKNWLLKELHKFLPTSFNNYHEPFLGGGSVFFYLKPKGSSFLSDSNPDLINAYRQVQIHADSLISMLKALKNTKEEYYRIRDITFVSPIERAVQFIYLNRTGFNGIYRVNMNGKYNVPYGYKTYKQLFNFENLRGASSLLKSANLECSDFEVTIKNINRDDLVFLDPPYTISHIKNGFIKYNEKLFSWGDQKRLAGFIEKVKAKKAFFILTNAKNEDVKDLFGKLGSSISIRRASVVGGKKAERGMIEEYIFSNAI